MRQLLGWMLGALLLLGQAQLADAQVGVSVGSLSGGTSVTVGQPFGVYPTTAVVGAPAYYAPGYIPTTTYYSAAYRGFRTPVGAYYPAPVVYRRAVAPYAYVGPLGRVRIPRRAYRFYP